MLIMIQALKGHNISAQGEALCRFEFNSIKPCKGVIIDNNMI